MSYGQQEPGVLFDIDPVFVSFYRNIADAQSESQLRPDLHPTQGATWKTGQNIRFFDGHIENSPGWVSAFTKPGTSPIRGIGQLLNVTSGQKLFFGDAAHLWRWDTGTVTDVSKSGGYTGTDTQSTTQDASVWSMVPWGKWMVATNGVDPLQLYKDTTGVFADVSTPFSTAEILVKNGPYVLAFNTSDGPNWVEWCTADDVETWAVSSTNTAGNYVLRDLDSRIIAAVPLGDRIGVYSNNQMFVGTYLGAPYIFGFQRALDGIGAVSKASVVPVGRYNYGVCINGFYQTDGTSFKYIDDPVRALFLDNVDWSNASKISAYHNEFLKQVIWFYPVTGGTGEPTAGLGYDYTTDSWHIYDYGRTAAVPREVFDYPVLGASDGSVYFGNYGVDADGSAKTSVIQTSALKGPSAFHDKLVQRVYVGMEELTGTLDMYIGSQQRLSDAVTWNGPYTISQGMTPVWTRTSGRWITFKFESNTVGAKWKLSTIKAYGKLTAARP